MPTSIAARAAPTVLRATPPDPRRRSAIEVFAVVAVRLLTALVGAATAVITLGPRALVADGMSGTQAWLDRYPSLAHLVVQLGGVEPAGNLLLFVPFASLLALAVGPRYLPVAFLLLLCSPFAVEWAQQYLPGRVPDGNDIVRNTTGLLVSFCTVAVLRLAVLLIRRLLR
jgi:VanZ family protein